MHVYYDIRKGIKYNIQILDEDIHCLFIVILKCDRKYTRQTSCFQTE